jgi:hypothetical protein
MVALSLALWMGYKWIGMIGVDGKGHPMEKNINNICVAFKKMLNFGRTLGASIWNLSPKSHQSLVDTIPRITNDKFLGIQ